MVLVLLQVLVLAPWLVLVMVLVLTWLLIVVGERGRGTRIRHVWGPQARWRKPPGAALRGRMEKEKDGNMQEERRKAGEKARQRGDQQEATTAAVSIGMLAFGGVGHRRIMARAFSR